MIKKQVYRFVWQWAYAWLKLADAIVMVITFAKFNPQLSLKMLLNNVRQYIPVELTEGD